MDFLSVGQFLQVVTVTFSIVGKKKTIDAKVILDKGKVTEIKYK